MCGIAGYCLKSESMPSNERIMGLLEPLRKRGPDDEGVCFISRAGQKSWQTLTPRSYPALQPQIQQLTQFTHKHDLVLIHTRYAILDLSHQGHQPFISQDQSITAIFNGEIYNYIELRRELISQGVNFRTQSDTEVLVEGYARWKDALWPKLNGFWAIVIYDHHERVLILSRDRLGVAPLYYRQTSKGLFFASYLTSLLNIEGESVSLNQSSILGFAQTGFKDIDESTFYNEIKSVPEASVLRLSANESNINNASLIRYWTPSLKRLSLNDISFDRAVNDFRDIFFDAVKIRLRADVSIAFELSGGLDSSSVVAAAAVLSDKPLITYTAKIKGADEEPFARLMTGRYNLNYNIIENKENDFSKDYASFNKIMEEPFDNPNAYTHFQMLNVMKNDGAQVVLTGAGGDEVFAGYEASFWPKAYQELRQEGGLAFIQGDWYEFCRRFKTINRSLKTITNYFSSIANRLSEYKKSSRPFINQDKTPALIQQEGYKQLSFDEQRRFHFDVALLPFYMRSSDHFTMGIPIEHRFPLLDYRLVEFGLSLPIEFLFSNGWAKYLLRRAMDPYLPAGITWRRQKMGFQFPFQMYFKNNVDIFKPFFLEAIQAFPGLGCKITYEELLALDPVVLWRLISLGIWQKGLNL